MAGIYLHIPFCKQACYYCDFHFSTSLKLKDNLLIAMQMEMEKNSSYLSGEEVSTIYFGGGTPSLLSGSELSSLLLRLRSYFSVSPVAEITLEANPDDLSMEKLTEMKSAGINRLSIGVQSFRDEDLQLLNRAHNSDMANRSLHLAREAGFENISVDLIYGIPGLDNQQWMDNLGVLLSFHPQHISAYSLTIEDRTVFGHRMRKGKFVPAGDEAVIEHFQTIVTESAKHGYEQYEISNFSLPSFVSKHNSSYWTGEKYLGIGPSAHSFNGTSRRWNVSSNPLYIKKIMSSQTAYEEEVLTEVNRFNEIILTSLRTSWGLDLKKLEKSFSTQMIDKLKSEAIMHIKDGSIRAEDDKLFLTEKGKLVADKVSSDLFAT